MSAGTTMPPLDAALMRQRPRSRALNYLRNHLRQSWSVGDQLPSEESIAERLEISRGTVRAAFKELEAEGVVGSGRGIGRTVLTPPDQRHITRNVPPALAAAGEVMRQSVIFARSGAFSVADRDSVVEQAIIHAFSGRGNPVISVNLTTLDGPDLDRLAAGCPLGLVAPHQAAGNPEHLRQIERLADAGVHIVVQGDSPTLAHFDRVISDHDAGARLMLDELARRGIRRPVQCRSLDADDPDLQYWARARYDVFDRHQPTTGPDFESRRVLAMNGHEPLSHHDAADTSVFQTRVRLIAGLLLEIMQGPDRPDALLFDTDYLCFYAAAALRLYGLEPGRDVLLCGYDDYWANSPLRRFEPACVDLTIDKDEKSAGEVLADMLLDTPEHDKNVGRLGVRMPVLRGRLMQTRERGL